MRQPRMITKSDIKGLMIYALQSNGMRVSNVVYVDETPNVLRHSCFQTGVALLQKQVFTTNTVYGVLNVNYYFCTMCGKLFIDSMKGE